MYADLLVKEINLDSFPPLRAKVKKKINFSILVPSLVRCALSLSSSGLVAYCWNAKFLFIEGTKK